MSKASEIRPFPVIYVAGPYIEDEQVKMYTASQLGGRLLDRGVACEVPHTAGRRDAVTPRPHEDWVALDMAVLGRCDAVALLWGWIENSDMAAEHARSLGMMVIEQAEEEDDAAFADRVAAWAEAVRDRPRVSLIIDERGRQHVMVGTLEVWSGEDWAWPAELLTGGRVGASEIDGVSVAVIDEDDDDAAEAVLYLGVEVKRWSYGGECYPVDVLSALRDAGAITLRVVDKEVMP